MLHCLFVIVPFTLFMQAAYGESYPPMDKLANRLATHSKSNDSSVPYGAWNLDAYDSLVECLCSR
jgi:hypothetical protein